MRAFPIDARAVASLDKVMHEPARLSVVACLSVVDEADFVFLQGQTGMTGGNLSSHISKLDKAGYIEVRKEFSGSRPRTTIALTKSGRDSFAAYIESMRRFLEVLEKGDSR